MPRAQKHAFAFPLARTRLCSLMKTVVWRSEPTLGRLQRGRTGPCAGLWPPVGFRGPPEGWWRPAVTFTVVNRRDTARAPVQVRTRDPSPRREILKNLPVNQPTIAYSGRKEQPRSPRSTLHDPPLASVCLTEADVSLDNWIIKPNNLRIIKHSFVLLGLGVCLPAPCRPP